MGVSATATTEHRRATVRPDKAAAVAELAEEFRSSSAAVLTEYRGLTVKQVTALRVALGADTTYAVVKNTLTRLAAAEAGLTGLDALLAGPTAVAFVKGEPVEAAKALRDYARANPQLVVKGGVLDGAALTADEVRGLADLESRDVLLAKMAGALKASLSQAVHLFNAPLAQVARLAGALQAKAEEDPSVIGGAGTPAPAAESDSAVEASLAPAVDAPAVDAPAVEAPVAEAPVAEPTPADSTPDEGVSTIDAADAAAAGEPTELPDEAVAPPAAEAAPETDSTPDTV